ncbi:hypothetical protein H0H93_013109, partial [Arthromyces matolae]
LPARLKIIADVRTNVVHSLECIDCWRASARSLVMLMMDVRLSGKVRTQKRVQWADQDNSEIPPSKLKANILTAQKEWILTRTPMPSFILPQEKGHFQEEVQGIQHKIEGYESALQGLANSYLENETFDDAHWSQTQINLLRAQQAEIASLVDSDKAHLDYQRSWILPKMMQALKIFLFPVYQNESRGRYIRNQAIEHVVYYQHLDKEHRGKSKWIMCHDNFTRDNARQLMKLIEFARAKEEWISSPTPIPSEFAEEELYDEEKFSREIAKKSLKNLLKFVEGEQDSDDNYLGAWQKELLISQQAIFEEIDETTHYRPSVALQLLLEALKIFLFPVYKELDSDIKKAAIKKVKYYQKVYEEHHGKTNWETCSAEKGKFTNKEAEELLEKVVGLLKSIPKSEMADKENHH